jgi:hypothetical protein
MKSTRAHPSLVWKSVLMIVAMVGISASGLLARPARAQGEGAYFPVFVLACDAYVTMKGSASGEGYPPECRGLGDVTVTAYDTEGTRLDACTTDADGTCRLAIDYNGTRIFQQDTKNVPEGYRAEENVQRVFTYTEFAEIAFHNYREDVFPQRDAPRATVRVNTRIWPDQYSGDSFFDDCNSGVPKTDQWIFGSATYARAGKDGNALLKGIAAGNNTEIIGGQGPDTGDIFFYCSLTNDPQTRIPTTVEVTAQYDGITRDFVGKMSLDPQADVTCDWYQIPHLDRGLWDTVVNVMAEKSSTATYDGGTGNIDVTLFMCPDSATPKTADDPAKMCTEPAVGSEVQAVGKDGTMYASATTDNQGKAQIALSGQTVPEFWIVFEGHSTPGSPISCVANRMDPQTGKPLPPLYQATTDDPNTGWTIPGLGDDMNGISCDWYLVPSGWKQSS